MHSKKSWFVFIVLLAAAVLSANAAWAKSPRLSGRPVQPPPPGGGATDGPNGFTTFTPSLDTRIVYVSQTGVDHCQSYAANAFADPFNPPSTVNTCRTLDLAYGQIRNQAPDWVLLKRGDTWSLAQPFDWNKWGASSGSGRMLLGSYGSGARPKIIAASGFQGLRSNGGSDGAHPRQHLAIVDLHLLSPFAVPGTWDSVGLLFPNSWNDLLIENCRVEGFYGAIEIPINAGGAHASNITIRRNQLLNAYNSASGIDRSVGIYGGGSLGQGTLDGFLLEENLFYRTGLRDGASNQGSLFAHAIYMSWDPNTNFNFTIRRNLFVNNADGGKIGAVNATIDNNTYIMNAISVLACCDVNNAFTNNVVMEPNSYYNQNESIGELLDSGSHTMLIAGNIMAHQTWTNYSSQFYEAQGFDLNASDNVTVTNNVVYNWCAPSEWGSSMAINASGFSSTVVIGNEFQQACNGMIYKANRNPIGAGVTYTGNKYYSQQSAPFAGRTFNQWVSDSHETGAVYGAINYTDPHRDPSTYMGQPFNTTAGFNAFVNAALAQDKATWNSRLTAAEFNDYIRVGFNKPTLGGGGQSQACQIADFNHDGAYNVLDFQAFETAWTAHSPAADLDHDGNFTVNDFQWFSNNYAICTGG